MNSHPLLQLAREIIITVPTSLVPTGPAGILFWVVMFLVWLQYRKMASMEEKIHGFVSNNPWYHTATAAVYGIVGGVMGSFFMVLGGVTIQQQDIIFLWPVALGLMLISPRLLCFSYAAGLVSFSHLMIGWPSNINVASIMALVAILHLMEGMLVRISGHQVSSPVYVQRPGDNKREPVGAYLLQRFWPIPIMVVFFLQIPPEAMGEAVDMPRWWPLIDIASPLGEGWARVIIPVVAALGYSDIAITESPRQRARRSAVNLWIFSVVLMGLSLAATRDLMFAWAAAVFAPLGHEAMVRHGNQREMKGEPEFVSPEDGVRIMALQPGGCGEQLGLHHGDVVLAVNGESVSSRQEMEAAISESDLTALTVRRHDQQQCRIIRARHRCTADNLQVITAPEPGDKKHVDINNPGFIIRWLRKIVARFQN